VTGVLLVVNSALQPPGFATLPQCRVHATTLLTILNKHVSIRQIRRLSLVWSCLDRLQNLLDAAYHGLTMAMPCPLDFDSLSSISTLPVGASIQYKLSALVY